MVNNYRGLLALLLIGAPVSSAHAQERSPLGGSPDAKETPPPQGVEKFYWDLTKSQDRAIKAAAERYVNLVKLQEWSDLSGKFKTIASYVKHTPDMSTVTIEIVKGRGAEQKKEQKTVPVDKLSKPCQTRVRQIDAAQKRLKELAGSKPGENGAAPDAGAGPAAEGVGAPMRDEAGASPAGSSPPAGGPEGGAAAPPSAPTAAEPDPSASDPDPLGFAELPPAPAAPPAGEAPPGN